MRLKPHRPTLLETGLVLILVCSLLGHFSNLAWPFVLLDQFQLHALAAGIVLLLAALPMRRWLAAGLATAVLVSAGVHVAPLFFHALTTARTADGVKVISYNVLSHNRDQASVVAWLREQRAGVVGLPEANAKWNGAAETLRDLYPHQVRVDHPGNFGQILLSASPFVRTEIIHAPDETAMIQADIRLPDKVVRFLLVHPWPPVSAVAKEQGETQIRHIATLAQASPYPIVVMGDFNAAPWTGIMVELARTGGLSGFTLRATWPTGYVPFGFPIDHILGGKGAIITLPAIGPKQKSDHRAVIGFLEIN